MGIQGEWAKGEWKNALERVAGHLESFEDFIIPFLLARAQYCANLKAYAPGESGYSREGSNSLLEVRLHEFESIDAEAGRYTAPEERPFTNCLPGIERKFERQPVDVFAGFSLEPGNIVSVADGILEKYILLLPEICRQGDDKHYGSSVENDIHSLRAIATRIHYGAMYVAECKFNIDPEAFSGVILAGDEKSAEIMLTRPDVEERIIERVEKKVRDIQKERNPIFSHIVNPRAIVRFYETAVIPLTKKGEVMYLMQKKL